MFGKVSSLTAFCQFFHTTEKFKFAHLQNERFPNKAGIKEIWGGSRGSLEGLVEPLWKLRTSNVYLNCRYDKYLVKIFA